MGFVDDRARSNPFGNEFARRPANGLYSAGMVFYKSFANFP